MGIGAGSLHLPTAVEANGGEAGATWGTWDEEGVGGDCGRTDGRGVRELRPRSWSWGFNCPHGTLTHPGQEELLTLFFSETLVMVSDTGEPQGELTIEVQRGKYKDQFGVMAYFPFVHAFSRGFMDKIPCGNSILGRVPAA